MNRNIKRLIYGTGYLIVFFAIVYGIYFFAIKPAPSCFDGKLNGLEEKIDCGGTCAPCAEKELNPLSISWKKYFPSKSMTAVAIEVKNSNSNYGADYFDYEISLIGEGNKKLTGVSGNSFIYAGEIKHILEILPISFEPGKTLSVEAELSNMKWKSKEEFLKPQVEARGLIGKITETPPTIEGVVSNQSAYPLSKAAIFGFVYNDFGLIGAASKTEMENVPAFGEKKFIINFPLDLNVETVNPDSFKVFIEAKR